MIEISPLFAVEAEQLLLAGMIDEAFDLCLSGIEAFPNYPSGHAILAKCYFEKKDFDNYQSMINNALKVFPTNRQLKNLKKEYDLKLSEIENIVENINIVSDEEIVSDSIENNSEDLNAIIDVVENNENNEYFSEDIINVNEISELNENIDSVSNFEIIEDSNELLVKNEISDEILIENENVDYSKNENFLKLIQNSDDDLLDNYFDSSNLDIIHGLEYSPMKLMKEQYEDKLYIQDIPEFPPFKIFEKPVINRNPKISSFRLEDYSIPDEILESDPFNQLAQKLDEVKGSKFEEKEQIVVDNQDFENELVSVTLAKIYEQQNAFESAILMYEKLLLKEPANEDFYLNEIKKLKKKSELM